MRPLPGRPRVPARRGLRQLRAPRRREHPAGRRRARSTSVAADRVAASRPVSRVLCRDLRRGDDHPSLAAGYPTAQAADPRTGQRDLFRSTDRLPGRSNRVLLFGLAPSRVCRVSPTALGSPRARLRLCGTGPRLTADGRYPLPCAEELGLSSRSRPRPSARDRPADSPGGILVQPAGRAKSVSLPTGRSRWTLAERTTSRRRRLLIRRAGLADARAIAEVAVAGWRAAYRGMLPDDFLDAMRVDAREVAWHERLARDVDGGAPGLGRRARRPRRRLREQRPAAGRGRAAPRGRDLRDLRARRGVAAGAGAGPAGDRGGPLACRRREDPGPVGLRGQRAGPAPSTRRWAGNPTAAARRWSWAAHPPSRFAIAFDPGLERGPLPTDRRRRHYDAR